MRRNRLDFMAIGAILAGAVIGAGGTMAIVGNPFERSAGAAPDCGSVWGSANSQDAVWLITVNQDGERRVKRCPRSTWSVSHSFRTSRRDGERGARHGIEAETLRDAEEALAAMRALQDRIEEQARTMARERSVVVHYSR